MALQLQKGNPIGINPKWPRVVFFGDSQTQQAYNNNGWLSQISDSLIRKCDVQNRGFSGYNTRWCRIVLPRLFPKSSLDDIAAFYILLGSNDASTRDAAMHVPVAEYHDNLSAMVTYLLENGVEKEKIALISPPPWNDAAWFKTCHIRGIPLERCEEDIQDYIPACQAAAKSTGVEYIDLYNVMTSQPNLTAFLSDGLHFSSLGAKLVFDTLWPSVKKKTKNLPVLAPLWSEIDPLNPECTIFVCKNIADN